MTLDPSEVWNLKKRLRKIIPTDHGRLCINDLEQRIFQSDDNIFDGLNLFCKLGSETSSIANDAYHLLHGSLGSEHRELIEEYLSNISDKCPGFTFKVWKDADGFLIGVCWMTPYMRGNCELYGSYVCMDAMKRELNEFGWPYISVTSLNEAGKVVVLIESILLDESEEAYKFLVSNLLKMCPRRSMDNYFIVSGDGFFSQEMIRRIGFEKANFIRDRYHFREAVKKRFGSLYDAVRINSLSLSLCLFVSHYVSDSLYIALSLTQCLSLDTIV